ncbi:MAG TPA: Wzz/FepE/Etk N-terminal domain-containing protein [Ktedonobacteraceae bacterium]|nr:Wzz/FepE/Etk N-terminal domain-containing protein [Ktedonobacteraceae bacterium]
MQLQHYAWLLRRRLWLILIGIVFCTGLTYVISSHATPTYEASALIQVTAPGANNASDVFSNQALAVSDALLVTSDDVLQAAAKSLPHVTVAQLKQSVSASPLDTTQLVEVRADAVTPDLAATVANTVAQAFIQHQTMVETARLQDIADQISLQLTATKTQIDQAQAKLSSLQQQNAPAAQIDQQNNLLNTYQLNYNSLLGSYNDIQLQKAATARSLTIVQSATPPVQPLGSRIWLNTAIAAAMSLLLMVVLVLLLDWADMTIKTPEDVARLALLEPLGSVPFCTDGSFLHSASEPSGNDHRLERAFAIIATSFNALNTGQHSLLITSLRPQTGTSTIAAQLAIALAQSGTRVLLIDAHIQRPALHQIFHLSNEKGLVNSVGDVHFLKKRPDMISAWLDQWMTGIPRLWVLPVGKVTGSSIATLRSLELRKLVSWLLQKQESPSDHRVFSPVDIIIFDTPALEEEADTVVLAPLCDSSLLVIEAGKEGKEAVRKAQMTLQRLGTPVLGVIVNRQKASHRSYLYINQPQQGMVPAEALPSAQAAVKYPLLEVQTLPLRAIPKTPGANHLTPNEDQGRSWR